MSRVFSSVTGSHTHQLVDGLETIGRTLYLQVFTAPNGIALLDWVPREHHALTVWIHGDGADLRVGRSVHVVLPLRTSAEVEQLLRTLGQTLLEGHWYETYEVSRTTGEVQPVSWRLGSGPDCLRSASAGPRPRTDAVRVRRTGVRWGPTGADPDLADF